MQLNKHRDENDPSDSRLGKMEAFESFKLEYNFSGEKWKRQKWGRNIETKCETIRKKQKL